MLKTVLFGFMANGYISLRELEDQCKVNLRFMYLMDHQTPSYRTFGYFINEVLADSIKEIFQDINKKIFETEHVDLQHLYIDGSKFEANANKYSWVDVYKRQLIHSSDSIRLLVVRTQLCKYLIERNTNTHCDAKL